MTALDSRHLTELKASAIADDVIKARGYASVINKRGLPVQFRDFQKRPGLLIPVRDALGNVATYQLKPDEPRIDSDRGRPIKYETAKDGRIVLDVPASSRPHLRNADVPLWITEGCKKVDSAVSHGIACVIGVLGVDMWGSGGTALPDWKEIELKDRRVYIAYDSDVMTKDRPRRAIDALGGYLVFRGADVRYIIMDDLPDGSKCGLDDWFAAGGSVLDLEARAVESLPGTVPDWEPPVPFDPVTGPALTLDALSPWHRAFVEGVATSTQTPPDLAAWASLATIGIATRGRYVVAPKSDWHEPAHLQCLQVLASGGGKSPVYKHIMRPVALIEAEWFSEWKDEHDLWELKRKALESAERKAKRDAEKASATSDDVRALEAVQKDMLEHDRDEPVLKRLTADDATAQALWSVMDRQGGAIGVASPEGGFLANITGRYSDAPIFEPVLKGFSGEDHTVDRRMENEHRHIARAILAMSISVQPQVIRNMGEVPGFQSLGVSSRLIMTFPEPVTWPDLDAPSPDGDALDWWEATIRRLATDERGSTVSPLTLPLSTDAQRVFRAEREWHRDEQARGLFADMEEWGRKYPGMVLRVAGLLHVTEEADPHAVPIAGATMQRAVTIMRPAIEHARIGHGLMYGTGRQDAARAVLDTLVALEEESAGAHGPVSSAAIYDRLRGRQTFQKSESVIAALRELEQRRYVALARRDGPGPHTYSVFLNPLYGAAKMRSSHGIRTNQAEPGTISHFRRPLESVPKNDALPPTGTDGLPEWEV